MLDNGHIPVGVPPLFDLACCRTNSISSVEYCLFKERQSHSIPCLFYIANKASLIERIYTQASIYREFPGSVHTRHLSQPMFYSGWPLTDGNIPV